MFHFFKLTKKRDIINSSTPIGTILKVYPKVDSHSQKPYRVVIIENTKGYFMTRLLKPEKHSNPDVRTFHYNSKEWQNYHHNRFIKIGKI
jgi:hypothetical protein